MDAVPHGGRAMNMPALELRDVTKSYADRAALDEVSLEVARGELVALVGANGAGKSTLLQLAVGLLEPTSGDVLVEGSAAGSLDARRSLSYIADAPSLYDDLTVNEHVEYVSRLHGGPARPEAADELLGILNLTARADDLPARFSRGLRQKTAIVLALVRPFSVLLVDEPFVGLDPAGQHALADLLAAAAPRARSLPPHCAGRWTSSSHASHSFSSAGRTHFECTTRSPVIISRAAGR